MKTIKDTRKIKIFSIAENKFVYLSKKEYSEINKLKSYWRRFYRI